MEAACARKRARNQLDLLDALTVSASATGMGATKEGQRNHEKARRDMLKRSMDYGNTSQK